jgi:hypothetical protein
LIRLLEAGRSAVLLAEVYRIGLFLLLLLSFHPASAQKDFRAGYIITLQKDTIKGLVHYSPVKIKAGNCEFKTDETSPQEIYDAEKITGLGFFKEDKYYESFLLPGMGNKSFRVFAEVLVKGRADLLAYDDYFYLQKDTLREKIEKVQLKESNVAGGVYAHKTYIGTLNRHLSDCLPAKLLSGEVAYAKKDFVDVFKKYSVCLDSSYRLYNRRPQSRLVKYHLVAGLNRSRLEYPDPQLNVFKPENNFFFGGGATVALPMISEHIFLTAEATYHQNEYRGKKEGYAVAGPVQKDYLLEVSVVKVPIALKLNFSKGNFTPYLKAGLTPFFPLRTKWYIEYQGTTEASYDIKEKTATLIIWGGVGFQRKISADNSLFIEFRLEKFSDYIGFHGPNGPTYIPSAVLNKMLVFGIQF